MTWVGLIVLGLIVGALAKLLLPGRDRGGIIITTLIGVVGSLLGAYVGSTYLGYDVGGSFFDLRTWVTALIGSLVLLIIVRLIFGSRDRVRR